MKLKNELHSKRYELTDLLDEYEILSEQRARLNNIADKVKLDRKLAKLGDAAAKLQDEVDSLEKAHAAAEIERARPLARAAAKECVELFEREREAIDELHAAWQNVYERTAALHEIALQSREQWLAARDLCWQAGEPLPKVPDFLEGSMTEICEMKNNFQAKFMSAFIFCTEKIQVHELTGGKQTHRQERRHSLSLHVFGSR